MCIKSDTNNGRQYQKWLFAVSKINKIGTGFISIFLLKARVSYLTISKRKNLSLPLKDETDQFVTCLVLPECLSVKIAFHPRTMKRIVMAPKPSLLFRCVSLFLPHLRTLVQEKRSEIVFVLGLVGGVSVSIHYCREISEYFSPNMAACAKTNFWQSDLLTPSARECTIKIWSTRTLLNLIAWLC